MATNTIQGMLNIFKDIVDRHYMINDFIFGPDYNVGADRPMKYPYLQVWCEASTISIVAGQGPITKYNFLVSVMDILDKDEKNYDDIVSDTDGILNTVLVEMSKNPFLRNNRINIYGDINKTLGYEESNDNICGWTASLDITAPINMSACDILIQPQCDNC